MIQFMSNFVDLSFKNYLFSGEYVCEIETHGSPLHQTSRLEILGECGEFQISFVYL